MYVSYGSLWGGRRRQLLYPTEPRFRSEKSAADAKPFKNLAKRRRPSHDKLRPVKSNMYSRNLAAPDFVRLREYIIK